MSDPVNDLKQELLAAAERRQGSAPMRRHGRRSRLLLIAATLAVATVVALLVTAPWSDSPGFLERAEAALAQNAGVLHATWEQTTTSTSPACTNTHGRNEIWIDQKPPYRYRAFIHDFPPGLACPDGSTTEIGGTFEPLHTLVFEPPGVLRVSQLMFNMPPDPVRVFRGAIGLGGAHDDGETELDGRSVHRIRFEPCPDGDCPQEASYVYVDSETFYPVEIRAPGYADSGKVSDIVSSYRTFEYLPRTAANLALTDIRAQHPDASGP